MRRAPGRQTWRRQAILVALAAVAWIACAGVLTHQLIACLTTVHR